MHVTVAIIVTMVTVNVGGEKYISEFDACMYESRVNLMLMGLRLTKYIELREN